MEQSTDSLRDGFEITQKSFSAPTDTSHLDAVTKRNVTICNLFSNHSLPIKDIARVLDESYGKVVRTIEAGKGATAGVHRIWWDLRMDPTDEITLRTRPMHVPEFVLGPDGTRKFPTAATVSVLVPPGAYTVKLVAGDVERTAPLTLLKDPNTAGTEEDVAAQTRPCYRFVTTPTSSRDDQHCRVGPRAARVLARWHPPLR
jgi:hypothetical protein